MTETTTHTHVIWWLSQAACEDINAVLPAINLSPHIKELVDSRTGRPARGRLWFPPGPGFDIEWDETKPFAALAEACGGLVISLEDAGEVIGLPGFVTDTRLNLLRSVPGKEAGGE